MAAALPVIAAGTSAFAAGAVLYRVIRPRFGVTVNCWFCNRNSRVPFGNQHCWDCPHCDQYNGFTEDGSYNKPIPSQHFEELNYPVTAEGKTPQQFNSGSAVLCERCSRNQLLKIRQLANFQPYDERNFDYEVEAYKHRLEDLYRLCWMCERRVGRVLETQDATLRRKLRDVAPLPPSPEHSLHDLSDMSCASARMEEVPYRAPRAVHVLRCLATVCGLLLLLSSLQNLLEHSHTAASPQDGLPRALYSYLVGVYQTSVVLVCTGTLSNMLSVCVAGKERLSGVDVVCCCAWLCALLLFSPLCAAFTDAAARGALSGDATAAAAILAPEDVFLLQALVSVVCFLLSLWSLVAPRRQRRSGRRISLARKSPNGSRVSGGAGDFSAKTTPTVTQAASVTGDCDVPPPLPPGGDANPNLETLNLGTTPRRPRSPPGGIFSQFNKLANNPASSSLNNGLHGSSINSLRHRRPLISPARFKPTNRSASRPEPAPHLWSSGLFAAFSSAKDPPFSSNHCQDEDKLSQFSEHRSHSGAATDSRISSDASSRGRTDDDDDDASAPAASAFRPVDPARHENPATVAVKPVECRPRSVMTQCFWGVSVGLNVALLLYLFCDLQTLRSYIAHFFQEAPS